MLCAIREDPDSAVNSVNQKVNLLFTICTNVFAVRLATQLSSMCQHLVNQCNELAMKAIKFANLCM